MKILFLTNSNIDSGFGSEVLLFSTARFLMNRGHHVSIICTDKGGTRRTFSTELASLGAVITVVKRLSPGIPAYSGRWFLKLWREMRKCDILYIMEPPPLIGFTSVVLLHLFRKPGIRGWHNPFYYQWDINGGIPSFFLFRKMMRLLIMRMYLTLPAQKVENSRQFGYLVKKYHGKPFFITACVDPPPHESHAKYSKFTVLIMGRLNFHKGTDLIPELYSKFKSSLTDFQLIVVGSGPMAKKVRDMHNGEDFVYMDYVTDQKKLDLLSGSHALVALSRVEAFFMTGVEALVHGTPLISLRFPGPEDYISDGEDGFLCDGLDDIVDRLSLMESRLRTDWYTDMCMKAQIKGGKFTCPVVLPDIEKMFLEVGQRGGR